MVLLQQENEVSKFVALARAKQERLRIQKYDQMFKKVAPHGNSLKTECYVQTKPSVLTFLKELSSKSIAKRALSFVSSDAGGVVHAHSASSLARSRHQVNHLIQVKVYRGCSVLCMLMCKEG